MSLALESYRGTPAGVILSLINESTNTGVDTLRQVEAIMEFLAYLDCASRYQDLPERAWPSDHQNILLLRRRCWSFSNGEFVKAGIDVMRQQYTGSDWDELKHTRQAIGFLHSFLY
ncbi:Unconventional myosin-XIX [Trifolium repens]|nr:Unconventional myosin-XIX [Trifolium repens]